MISCLFYLLYVGPHQYSGTLVHLRVILGIRELAGYKWDLAHQKGPHGTHIQFEQLCCLLKQDSEQLSKLARELANESKNVWDHLIDCQRNR